MNQSPTHCGFLPAQAGLASPDLPFRLNGSQSKTAFALRANCEAMIAGNGARQLVEKKTIIIKDNAGNDLEKFIPAHFICTAPEYLNATAFLTLTVGDWDGERFQQVFDAAEASKRFNLINRRLLKTLFIRAIVVSERHKNGAIHFHIVGVLRGCPDIRTGFDFAAFEKAKQARARGRTNRAAEIRYKIAAGDDLRAAWKMLRDELPKYGFGRAELTPIIKTGEAVACYVSKYIEKNICNRLKADKRKKLVRYIGEWKTVKTVEKTLVTMINRETAPASSPAPFKLRPNDFAWGSKRAAAWRGKARETASLIGCQSPEDCAAALGGRWAFYLSSTWQGRTTDDLQPFLIADWQTKRLLANDLAEISRKRSPGWLKENEKPMIPFLTAEDALELTGIEKEIYRVPENEFETAATVEDLEFSRLYETGWKVWKEKEKERLAEIAGKLALN